MGQKAVGERRRETYEIGDQQRQNQVAVVEAEPLSVVYRHEYDGKNATDIEPVSGEKNHHVAVVTDFLQRRLQFLVRRLNGTALHFARAATLRHKNN